MIDTMNKILGEVEIVCSLPKKSWEGNTPVAHILDKMDYKFFQLSRMP